VTTSNLLQTHIVSDICIHIESNFKKMYLHFKVTVNETDVEYNNHILLYDSKYEVWL